MWISFIKSGGGLFLFEEIFLDVVEVLVIM